MELKLFIFEAGITMKRMAQELGVSHYHFCRIVNKKLKPSVELAEMVQAYTKGLVTVDDMLDCWQREDPLQAYFKSKNLI